MLAGIPRTLFLVWNRHKDQLRRAPGLRRYPLIWAESVTADGRFAFRAEKRNHEPYFEVRPAKDDWLILRSPCVLLQRTTSKEQRRRLIASELPASFLEAIFPDGIPNRNYVTREMAARQRRRPWPSQTAKLSFALAMSAHTGTDADLPRQLLSPAPVR